MAATTLVAFRLPDEEHQALQAEAERAGTTKTGIIREALRRHLMDEAAQRRADHRAIIGDLRPGDLKVTP